MQKIIFVMLIGAIFGASVFAQKAKSKITPLPAGAARWVNRDSNTILENPAIQARLKKLLGEENYADFRQNWETLNPIVKQGNFLFSSGCLIHACLHLESAVAIDLKNNTVHAAVYTEPEKVKYFNEKGKTPKPLTDWAKRFVPPIKYGN